MAPAPEEGGLSQNGQLGQLWFCPVHCCLLKAAAHTPSLSCRERLCASCAPTLCPQRWGHLWAWVALPWEEGGEHEALTAELGPPGILQWDRLGRAPGALG